MKDHGGRRGRNFLPKSKDGRRASFEKRTRKRKVKELPAVERADPLFRPSLGPSMQNERTNERTQAKTKRTMFLVSSTWPKRFLPLGRLKAKYPQLKSSRQIDVAPQPHSQWRREMELKTASFAHGSFLTPTPNVAFIALASATT